MSEQQTSRVLAKWAEIFREEGDTETADAIELQLQGDASRTLSEEDADWLRRVLARARRADGRGAYEEAADSFAEALRTVESAFGWSHPQTFDLLTDLARCRLNAGQLDAALAGYSRLLRFVEQVYGNDDSLAALARQYIERCQKGIRGAVSSRRLQVVMNDMLRQSQAGRLNTAADRVERMRDIARRLAARGRRAAAVRLYEKAIALRLRLTDPAPKSPTLTSTAMRSTCGKRANRAGPPRCCASSW